MNLSPIDIEMALAERAKALASYGSRFGPAGLQKATKNLAIALKEAQAAIAKVRECEYIHSAEFRKALALLDD